MPDNPPESMEDRIAEMAQQHSDRLAKLRQDFLDRKQEVRDARRRDNGRGAADVLEVGETGSGE